ncbi:1-aminocyclopropane-1-carboxylate deaminase/D-cysteine desulfhydrase-like pyridoxal-dependent ACC family enzyme [Planomicrobium stackebrandtii]|uniref:1-aminocyclopropane-1-carboxylate deaminase/D-cysteine desulfhydrase-like pyridoxal-dependent ACC family enzyme n=1 Tax=Planomicrobium stackebrandtii TaxID=253160 RepID=A0ABU0GTG7_9BACL|nr:hypothetical protein [Planomicrobium stackebrandtii]MDQ0428654.1 1-aminocyclopropane-1-carboxylate deaminase/D-cysteine desulfhydrase-like pyridoxal-dependent ACC family enzyme [Planomicrobium stackebrandtii]
MEAAVSLNASDIQAEVNIIGFDVDNEGQTQQEGVAKLAMDSTSPSTRKVI